jgi:hypothetical protein
MHTKKVIPIDKKWAALLSAELGRRETVFPPEAIDYKGVCDLLKKAGLPSGNNAAHTWLKGKVKSGEIKKLEGLKLHNGKLCREVRYLCE